MQTQKVLLVNDDQASLFALESLLLGAAQQHVYQLITAGSGKQAAGPWSCARRWRLNTLKIDRTFVHGIGNDEGGAEMMAPPTLPSKEE